jgi:hypothetical protein
MPALLESPSLVWTKEELQKTYLFGVKLTNDQGEDYPDIMYENWLGSAQRTVERELDISLTPKTVLNEKHAFVPQNFQKFGFVNTYQSPIIDVTAMRLKFPGGTLVYNFPRSWITFDTGGSTRVQVVPDSSAGIPQILAGQGFNLLTFGSSIIPDLIEIDYKWGLQEVPLDIRHLIGMLASIDILNIAGDLIGGAGIASSAIALGGLSSSVSTTSSATNSGYGSRVIQYDKQIRAMWPRLKQYYGRGVRIAIA